MPEPADHTAAIRARLNTIRRRHAAHTDGIDHLGATGCCTAHVAVDDVPALLDALEAILRIEPSSHHDGPADAAGCRWCAGEAHTITRIRGLLAGLLLNLPVEDQEPHHA